jgi:rubrerythrin
MKFLETALELETETIKRYRALAERCTDHEGIRRILDMLISDHESHLASLRSWGDSRGAEAEDIGVFFEVKQMLEKMRSEKDTFSCSMEQVQLYREARDLVLQKLDMYQKIQAGLPDPAGRARLDQFILEEKKQGRVLDNIIRMVERPEQWLEDAEFSHLEEY